MWQKQNDTLHRTFKFETFGEAVDFINQVASVAHELNHHPKLQNVYNTVDIWLTTHDAGNKVTKKDVQFAEMVDALHLAKQPPSIPKSAKHHSEVKLFADGGSRGNPGPSASGFVILDMADNILVEKGVYLGITTNNQAEYQAVKFGLEEARSMNIQTIHVYLDSLLVVNQMIGKFKVKNRDLWPIHEAIKELMKSFKMVKFTHVPREYNKLADAEVNKVLDLEASKH
jgi:ribonuclease HI